MHDRPSFDTGTGASTTQHVERLQRAIAYKIKNSLGTTTKAATRQEWYNATVLAVRDRIIDIWLAASKRTEQQKKKRVYYLSIEFLIGRLLFDTLVNFGMLEDARLAVRHFGIDLDDLRTLEPDAGLGNGGLGRLAACYMDSMSALSIPAFGYGIRYEHGMFEQRLHNGWQQELPDDWLAQGNPWEFARTETSYPINFGGSVEYIGGDDQTARALWYPAETVHATPYDTPIPGWRGKHANTLRLWSARAASPIQLMAFNQGDHVGALAARNRAEAISSVLYPDDSTAEGQELRLRQEYFFTAASLQDLIKRHLTEHGTLETLADYAAIQLNDTHPAIAVAELMRILVDEQDFSWARAWDITRATLSYTNHTLLPEAIESWRVSLFGRLLPRHLQIIYLINWFHLKAAAGKGYDDPALIARISLVQEGEDKIVRMGHLAFVGSHHVNGVSALHTELLRETVFGELSSVTSTRIVNKTNGISFRRWLLESNEGLTGLLREAIGDRFLDDPGHLKAIAGLADDLSFIDRYASVRTANKHRLARILHDTTGIAIEPDAMFDVHIKRIHEYKRQLLNILESIALWQAIRKRPHAPWPHRVKIISGKAAASYERAKLIIKLANDVARVINHDPVVAGRLTLVFAPNYSVSLAQSIIPAADVSEQISTAGMEASGTGNMKLALNGALTIGTLDGANIEIRDHVGDDNVVIFGLTAAEVEQRRRDMFRGSDAVAECPRLSAAIHVLASGRLSPDDPARFAPIVSSLLDHDPFMVAADFAAYWDAQRRVDDLWRNPVAWWRTSVLNTAHMGWFSSDRAIREYAEDIWQTPVA